jgi:DNA-binding SARP family transcriptional activator
VLGSFAIEAADGAHPLPLLAQRLAVLLALRDEPVERLHAAVVLWPDVEHPQALANLRTALWRLRSPYPGLVGTCGKSLRSAPNVTIDLRESELLAHRILEDRLPLADARTAATRLACDLLPDWDDEWLVFERELFRDLRIHALERLCQQLTREGEHAEAVQCGLLAVQSEALRESAYRALMRAHAAEGNRARALQIFRTLERQLDEELQVAPSHETVELVRELRGPARLEVAAGASGIAPE